MLPTRIPWLLRFGDLFGFEHTQEISKRTAGEIAHAAQFFGQDDDITVLTLARVAEPIRL
jgi:hypothetical protein